MKKLLVILFGLTANLTSWSSINTQYTNEELGTIQGIILADEEGTMLPAPFANVSILGTTTGAVTDFDGKFSFVANPGTYQLVISSVGFMPDTLNVTVFPNEVVVIENTLKTSAVNLSAFVVVAKQDRTNEDYQLMEQKNATSIQQSIGAKEMSAKGFSDVAEGLTKVAGISKSNSASGSVFVRGMGDRYNNALLNGLPIPSPSPDQKVIPLDIFPTSIVSNLGISKTFIPNLYGDFAGGTIDITTKNYAEKATLVLVVGTSMNTQTTFKDFYTTNGDGLDQIGYENGDRYLPTEVASEDIYRTDAANPTSPFASQVSPKKITATPAYSVSLLGGSSKQLNNGMMIGYLVAGNHGNKYQAMSGTNRNVDTYGADMSNNNYRKYDYSTTTSAMENVYLEINDNHNVSFNSIYIHNSGNDVSLYDSQMEDRDRQGYLYSIRNTSTQNTLLVNQLGGNHKFGDNKLNVSWGGSLSKAKSDVPDRYQLLYKTTSEEKEAYLVEALNISDNHRFFSSLNENENAGKVDLIYNFKQDSLNTNNVYCFVQGGMQYRNKTRTFSWRQMNMNFSSSFQQAESDGDFVDPLNPDEYINDENISAGLYSYKEQVDPSRDHLIQQKVTSGYGLLNYDLLPEKLNITAGARVEASSQLIRYKKLGDLFSGAPRISEYDTVVVLPSLSIKYSVNEKSNVRAAASQTISRPSMKELSPFQYQDQNNVLFEGNPELYNSLNYNADLKFEMFPNSGEMVAVSVFGKYIKNPIERAQVPSSGILYSYFNMGEAVVGGAEFEFSKQLSNLVSNESSFLNNVTVGLNASYLYTQISLGDDGEINTNKGTILATNNTRAMTGSSPYLVNADLGYTFNFTEKIESKWTLTYNMFGKRVFAAGVLGKGDIYEMPINTLDLIVKNKINGRMDFNFAVKNILNPSSTIVQEVDGQEYVLNQYKRGQSFSIGISYKFL